MQIPAQPSWVSTRRRFEQKLLGIHKTKNLNQLKEIHALIYRSDLHQDLHIIPKLITAYSVCCQMRSAVLVFNQTDQPNVNLYKTLIRAHVENSQNEQAFEAFFLMQRNGIFPDSYTYTPLLKACEGHDFDIQIVKMIHAHIIKRGFCSDIYLPNSLIEHYSRFGLVGVDDAKKLFREMEDKDTVSWNSMISGLVKANQLVDARKLFDEMPQRDRVSWNAILDGYVKAGELSVAFELFEKMPDRNVVSWSTMVFAFCNGGDMEMAKILFDRMPVKNMVSWTILIAGYAKKRLANEAACLCEQMLKLGFEPNDEFIISILDACADSGLLELGKGVHQYIKRTKYRCSILVETTLIDMYAKCGSLNEAVRIFNKMDKKDIVVWNTMIHGLAMHRDGKEALRLFSEMRQEGFAPDNFTFVSVLCACTLSGFVDEGIHYFYTMEKNYGVVPDIYHYGCVIDLLGRAGRLEEAFMLVRTMPFEPNVIIWSILYEACQFHNATELAQEVSRHLKKPVCTNPGTFSMLSTLLPQGGVDTEFANVRSRMKNTGNEKSVGASLIELADRVLYILNLIR